MKERFDATEWEAIRALPFHLFIAIAMADGKIQKEELEEFGSRLTRGAIGYKDPCHRELARDIVDSDAAAVKDVMASQGGFDPKKTKQILKDKLTAEEYHGLLTSLFIDLIHIAKASKTKKGLFRKTVEIDEDEQKRLAGIAVFWEIDIGRLAQA